jgi:hypothetical protein
MKYILKATIFSLAIIFASYAGNNLPQTYPENIIKGKDHKDISTYFSQLEIPPSDLDADISNKIKKHLPKELQNGCREMIAKWGSIAKGKDSTALRALTIRQIPNISKYIFFALTCFSTAPGFGDKYYDERLMVLSIHKDSSKLTIFSSGKPCKDCTDLTRIGLDDDTLMIAGTQIVSINFGSSTNNPCCDTPVSIDEAKIKYYQIAKEGVREILSIIRNRKEIFYDKVMGDSTTIYEAAIDFEKNNLGFISQVNINHTTSINDIQTGRGIIRYIWNRKANRFDEGSK